MRAFIVSAVLILAPGCTGYDCYGNPISGFQAVQQGVARAAANASGVATTCYVLTPPATTGASPQAVGGTDNTSDAGAIDCAPAAGDDACVACLKADCCAAAANGYDPAVRCGLAHCAAECATTADGGAS